jgi:predicted O-methyltransferase YrrM
MKVITVADTVLRDIEGLSGRGYLPVIGPVKGRLLAETVREYDVLNVLEVGTLIGYSAILLAENLPPGGKVITIEINNKLAGIAQENTRKAGLAHVIEVRNGNALNVIPSLHEKLDMIFLDGAKHEYLGYLKLAERMLRPGGIVFADNVKLSSYEMRDYLDYVRRSGRYSSFYIDTGYDGIERSIKLY